MGKFKESIVDFLKNRVLTFIKANLVEYLLLILPFLLMDVFIRVKATKIDYDRKGVLQASILFSLLSCLVSLSIIIELFLSLRHATITSDNPKNRKIVRILGTVTNEENISVII